MRLRQRLKLRRVLRATKTAKTVRGNAVAPFMVVYMIKRVCTSRLLLLFLFFFLHLVYAATPVDVYWEDLIPEESANTPVWTPPAVLDHNNKMQQLQPNAPVVKTFDGKRVRVPGFIVPLEGDAVRVTEFLLVPFFGACIHVPPPPSNQIVHVTFPEGVETASIYDAVWVTGIFSSEGWSGEIATVGYRLTGESITAF